MRSEFGVAVVAPLPPIKGGVAQHSSSMVGAFEDLGNRVTKVSWCRQYPARLYPGDRVDKVNSSFHTLSWWNPVSWLSVRRLTANADLIVFPWFTPFNFWVLVVLVTRRRGRCVAIVHNVETHERVLFNRLIARLVLHGLSGYVTHSKAVAGELEALIGGRRIVTVAHPPNLKIEAHPFAPFPPIRLLFLGHLRPYKGIDVLIDAVSKLRLAGSNACLTVAGEDWGIGKGLMDRAETAGVAAYVDFQLGYVPDDDVDGLIADHHILVQPYLTSSQSGVVPLAHEAGRPVVVTRTGGLDEAVEVGITGEVALPGDPLSLAEAITRATALLDNPMDPPTVSWRDVARAVLSFSVSDASERHRLEN